MCSDSEKNMSAFADQNHAPSLTCVRLEFTVEKMRCDNGQMAEIFADWNEGKLRSYLIEITANILRHFDKS